MNGLPAGLQEYINKNIWIVLVATMLVAVAAVAFRPPKWVIDGLIVINWAAALAVFALVFRIESSAKLASFPTVLQLLTTMRVLTFFAALVGIVLEFQAGRLVSRLAPDFTGEAMLATLMTLVLLVLMYKILLAKGSERVATVSARFALDGMPGKQMSIDADFRAGAIDIKEAQRRRERLQKEMQFFGSMEGAAKYINAEGNLILIAAALGIVAAITAGTTGEPPQFAKVGDAAREGAKLVGGAGLAVILPAIMMSIAMTLLITQAPSEGSESGIGVQIGRQFLTHPVVPGMAGFTMVVLGLVLIRGWFGVLLALLGAAGVFIAWKMARAMEQVALDRARENVNAALRHERRQLSRVILELSPGLIAELGADWEELLLRSAARADDRLYELLGVKAPEPALAEWAAAGCRLRLLIDGISVHEIELPPGARFVTAVPGDNRQPGRNRVLADVVGRFVPAGEVPLGADAPDIAAAMHLVICSAHMRSAHEFVGVDETKLMLDHAATSYRELVNQTVPDAIKLVELAELFRGLVREQISIRDVRRILEAILRGAQRGLKSDSLLGYVRTELARQITHQFAPDGHLRCIQITRETDAEIHEKQRPAVVSGGEPRLFLAEARRRALDDELREGCAASLDRGFRPVIVCRPEVRQVVQSVARGQCPDVVVLAVDEILPDVTVTTVAWIGDSVPPDSTGSQ